MVMPGTITGRVSIITTGGTSSGGGNFTVTPTKFPSAQQGAKLVGTGVVIGEFNGALQGYSVAISADGNTAVIGGLDDNSAEGAAWIFTRNGGCWTQQAKLVGTGNVGNAEQGYSVSLSADGNCRVSRGNW